MSPPQTKTVNLTSVILGFLIIAAAIVFESLFHSFLHTELHPLDGNHLVVGSTTALLSAFLVVILYLRTRQLSKEVLQKEFELRSIYEDDAFFRILSEKSSNMIHLNDSEGTILYVNPVTIDLLGFAKDEIVNKPAENFIHPEDRKQIRKNMGQVIQGKDIPPCEIRLLTRSGHYLDVEVKGFSINTEGDKKYIGAILRDISNHKQNKQLLLAQEEWEKTFNSMEDFVSVHDKDFKVIKANSSLCELLGKTPEEIVGKHCYQLFHNMDEPHENCPHRKSSEASQPVSEIISDPNIGVPLQIVCSPMFDDGAFKGSVHIARVYDDVDKQKKNAGEIIPICAACKNIRNENNEWVAPEDFFVRKYGNRFTHSVCKDCQAKLYPEYIEF